MGTAEKLRALRVALPGKPGVRQIAAEMGYPDTPNAYGYYEGKTFTKKTLPLDKAMEIATVFQHLGGDPKAVLALTALSAAEIEEVRIPVKNEPTMIQMAVAFPSVPELTGIFRTMLDMADRSDLADELAPKLARLLPGVLGQGRGHQSVAGSGAKKSRTEDAQPLAKDRPERPSQRHS